MGKGLDRRIRVRAPWLAVLLVGGCEDAAAARGDRARGTEISSVARGEAPDVDRPAVDLEVIARRDMKHAALALVRRGDAIPFLQHEPRDGSPARPVRCDDPLEGAWGLWLDDVDGDGNAEAIVALHKRARFDDRLANRLHVYSFEEGRCVPAWRGTRLAGRFDAVTTHPGDDALRGRIDVHEWLGPRRRRVARYRWSGFGYRLERVHWEGEASPPAALVDDLDFGPRPAGALPDSDPDPDLDSDSDPASPP